MGSSGGGPVGAMSQFGRGMRAALRGMQVALGDAEVRRAHGVLLLAMLGLAAAFDVGGIWTVLHLTEVARSAPWWEAAALWILRALGIVFVLLATPVFVLVGSHLALPLLAERVFFAALRALDPVRARALEARSGRGVAVAAIDNLVRLARFALLTLALFALALIPGLGVIAAPLQLYFTARALAWELLDPYFERCGLRLRAQRAFVARHHAALIGFGLPLALLLAIPLVGSLLLGLSQAAAAALVHEVLDDAAEGGPGPGIPDRLPAGRTVSDRASTS